MVYGLDVHGGVTYAGDLGRGDGTWWLGFDCAHASDIIPAQPPSLPALVGGDPTYKGYDFVVAEAKGLARAIRDSY